MSTSRANFEVHFRWAFFRWNIGQYDPVWVIDSIIYELAAIPTLRDINLQYLKYSSHIGNLDAFSNLHKIRVQITSFGLGKAIIECGKLLAQCPGLIDLDISIEGYPQDNMAQLFQFLDQTGEPLSLRHLRFDGITVTPDCLKLTIGNLRSLQSLHIYRFSSNGMGHNIWDILRKERIYIQNLSTDAADDSLPLYLSSFHGMRKFSIIKYSSLQFDPIAILQSMIPHHAESLTEFSMLAGSGSQSSDQIVFSENLINLLSSVKNLQYIGLQLHILPCYISIIVGVFCNGQHILFITLTRSRSQESIIRTCTKKIPKLQQLVLHTPRMAWHPQSAILLPTVIVHDAITQYQPNDLSVASFKIECEGLVYFPGQEGTFSLVSPS